MIVQRFHEGLFGCKLLAASLDMNDEMPKTLAKQIECCKLQNLSAVTPSTLPLILLDFNSEFMQATILYNRNSTMQV